MENLEKKTVLSLVQPTGDLTIGNYLGAIKNFSKLQNEYKCFFAVADLHAITVPQVPKDLRAKTLEILALYIASGLDVSKTTLFIQSHVKAHVELAWLLDSISYMGQLSRMTQYKDKSQKGAQNQNAALFTYPVLMAADILLYQTDYVPVGEDQKQHLELARDLAERFNSKYSNTFKLPEMIINKSGKRIMSLKNPEKKMSKSDEDKTATIFILDNKEIIESKILRSVTDSFGKIKYSEEQKGLKNLLDIYAGFSNDAPEKIAKIFENKSYKEFKLRLAELIYSQLEPIQKNYYDLITNKDKLIEIYTKGASNASFVANKTLYKVYRKMGFVLPK